MIGIGSAAANGFVFGEKIENTLENLQSEKVQTWIGNDIRNFHSIIQESRLFFPRHSGTRTAIDIALHDSFCRFLGIAVVDFYGLKHKSMLTSVTIGISTVSETLEDAKGFLERGFKVLKIKTGLNIDEDIEHCIKLRERFGKDLKIRVDANQGYDTRKTLRFIEETNKLGLEFIEQPMPVKSENEMRLLPAEIRNIIACDESLKNAGSAIRLASEPKPCGIINIKLMKSGGVLEALDIATIAQAAGIDLYWGCFDENMVSITAALHTAFSCAGTKYLDLDGSLFLAEDVVRDGFILKNGELSLTDGSGFGYKKI